MRITFRKRAETDLQSIVAWFEEVAPDATPRIIQDIHAGLARLTEYPRVGVAVPGTKFRRIVTRRYHFKIAYDVRKDEIQIAGIYRYQDPTT